MDDNVRAYLISVLAYGIKLDFDNSESLDSFAMGLVDWCQSEIDGDFIGDADGILCLRNDELKLSITFFNDHLKFHTSGVDVFDSEEDSNLIVKIVLAVVGYCQSYFEKLPQPEDAGDSHPSLDGGTKEEVIVVVDDGFGIV